MSEVNRLINVTYKDLTNYAAGPGADMLGCPFEHYWGPVNELIPMSQQYFFETYPEELPAYQNQVKGSRFFAYASIKKAFENGIKQVEAYRVRGNWQYIRTKVQAESGQIKVQASSFVQDFVNDLKGSLSDCVFAIYSKYPGLPPASELNGDQSLLIQIVSAEGSRFTINIVGANRNDDSEEDGVTTGTAKYIPNETNLLESWDVSLDPTAEEDGQSIFVENVLQKSQFISAKVGSQAGTFETYHPESGGLLLRATYFPFDALTTGVAGEIFEKISVPTTANWEAALTAYSSTMLSDATLLISPVSNTDLDSAVKNIAGSRQDLNAIIGYAVDATFDFTNIKARLLALRGTGIQPKFSFFAAGREMYKVFGLPVTLNCTGGWCGATAAVAESEKVNQLASAFTYGSYNGDLIESLTFDQVCDLMELGGISIFTSVQGPIIWGTRSLHQKQTSYFGKANVMRVLARILRQVFPICLDAIHTDAAANPITRATYQSTFSGIITDEIAAENLQSDSYADCGASVNTDKATKGGTIFNLNLMLHFIGLVESVNIKVFATDSSVSTNIA